MGRELATIRQVVGGVDLGGIKATEVEGADLVADEHGGRAVDEGRNGNRVHGQDVEGVFGHGDVHCHRYVECGHAKDLADGGEPDDALEVRTEKEENLLQDLRREVLYGPHGEVGVLVSLSVYVYNSQQGSLVLVTDFSTTDSTLSGSD